MDDYEKFKGSSLNWASLLFKKLEAQPTPATLEEALVPIRHLAGDAWDEDRFTEQMEDFDLCLGELLRGKLHDYSPEFAKAIHAYTLEVPSIYKICSKEMMASDRRGEKDEVSEGVKSVLGFYKFLTSALMHLPESYRHRDKAYRGVKWIYPSPEDHRPEEHFETGTKMLWLEMKSTSRKFELMHRPHFCGLHGPRTIFTIRHPLTGFRIEDFSAIAGEFEVLFPPLSVFEIVETTKQWDQINKRGFPDMVLLEQQETPSKWNLCKLFPDLKAAAPEASEPSAATAAAVPASTPAATSEGPDVGSPVSAAPAAKAKAAPAATPAAALAAAPEAAAATAPAAAPAATPEGLGQSASAPSLAGHAGAALRKAKPAEAAEAAEAAEPAKASADASATLAASVKAWDEPKESKEAKLPAADPDIKVPAAATIEELLRPRALTTTIEHAHDKQSVMAICPVDGEMFATGGTDHTVRLWRLGATGPEAVRAMKGHGHFVLAVAKVSPEVICTGSGDKTAKLWQVSSGRSLATLQGHTGSVYAVAALRPELLATGSRDDTVKLWQLPGGTCSATLRGHEGTVRCLAAVTPELLVSGSGDRTVRLWDAAKAQSLGTWRGHEDWVHALAALGGSTVASGSYDKTVKTWDVATGSNVLTLRGHGSTVCALQPLGPQALASGGGDKSVRIWDLRSGKCAQVLEGHTNVVNGLALMGKVLLSCGDDGTLRAWT